MYSHTYITLNLYRDTVQLNVRHDQDMVYSLSNNPLFLEFLSVTLDYRLSTQNNQSFILSTLQIYTDLFFLDDTLLSRIFNPMLLS